MATATAPAPAATRRPRAAKRGRPRTARSPASTDTWALRITRGNETMEVIGTSTDLLPRLKKFVAELTPGQVNGPMAINLIAANAAAAARTPVVRTPR